jgi:hypothetical protein
MGAVTVLPHAFSTSAFRTSNPKVKALGLPGVAYPKIVRGKVPTGRIHAMTLMLVAGKPTKGKTANEGKKKQPKSNNHTAQAS